MKERISDKKEITALAFLFMIAYMVSYITRINYGAVIAEVEKSTNLSRSLLSMAVTGSFVTYGVGQIISGVLGDVFSPKKMVSLGFIITVAMNVLLPLCQNPYFMLVVWCINGFAQSLMWPPMVRIMSSLLSDEDYKRTSAKVSFGASFGTIFVYLFSPLLISLWGWKSVFVFSAVCGVIMLFVWNKLCKDVNSEKSPKEKKSKGGEMGPVFAPVMLAVMGAIILQGMLRDGVTTWMPTYISETYNLGSATSILTGVVLPIFGVACVQISSTLYRKKIKNTLLCAGVIFGVGAISAVALSALSGLNAAFSVAFSALLTGCMHGVNLILICMVPNFFKKYGRVSTVSGIINACTYIGSAISTYGIALLSERMGWSFTLRIWVLIALLGTALCFLVARKWKKQYETEE